LLEKYVIQHQLLVGDVIINGAPRKKRMHTHRLKVWKLREPNVKLEFTRVVAERERMRYLKLTT